MDQVTPIKNKHLSTTLKIPASPFLKKIGLGTGITVYKFERSPIPNAFRSPWALKKLTRQTKDEASKVLTKRLDDEAAVLRKLDHPNIVGFRAFTKDSLGSSVLAMEECTTSLGDLIESRSEGCGTPYAIDVILKVCHDTARALKYLHEDMLLLHCDVKSYNILVKDDFRVCKLCDFGVCLPLTVSGELDMERAGENCEYTGTGCWCAPEILSYPQDITSKADIYSYGLVIWEMLALQPPVDESFLENSESFLSDKSFNENTVCEQVRQRPNLPDIEFSEDYNPVLEIFYCCTEVDKDKRPSALDLIQVLDNIHNK